MQIHTFKQRASDRLLGCNSGAIWTAGNCRTHHGLTLLTHDGFNVLEVNVHITFNVDNLGNPCAGIVQNIIGSFKAVSLGSIFVHQLVQVLVEHHDERMHMFRELFDTVFRHFHAPIAFERKGLGDHTYGQNTKIFCDFGNNWPGPSACSTAHTRSDKDHMRTRQCRANFFARRFGSRTALIRLGTRTEP